ncbi:MAG: hypothetical protein ABSA83_08835 [Verrucomicrobiota bacterium]|jgi:hypothetical protein
MRDKAALAPVLVCLLSAGPAIATAQIYVSSALARLFDQQGGQPPARAAAQGDLLQFVDGSFMHGEFKQMDTVSGLHWEAPAATNSIDFRPDHIDSIHFAHATSVTMAPTCHLYFVNGDDLLGSVTSLHDDQLGFSTWFGKSPAIPRASVRAITFLSSNYTILYEGPSDAFGWVVASQNPEGWTFQDGAFIGNSPGLLGRDFGLSGSSTIEFDLAWNEVFELLVTIYSEAVDHMDAGNAYVLEFTRDHVSFRHFESNHQQAPKTLGSAPWPNPGDKNEVRVRIQSNLEEGTVAVFIDNVLVKRWKDQNGFSPTGAGLLFQQVGGPNTQVKLSNIRISQWQGRYEPDPPTGVTNADVIRFINHDQAAGKIIGINGGKVAFALDKDKLEVPLQRVTQINFAAPPASSPAGGPWQVRARFPCGGNLSFQLSKWSDQEVSGQSAVFGPVAFQRGQIRQLEFNLGHAPADALGASEGESEGLDDVPPKSSPASNAAQDILLFRNGDLLYGRLAAIDVTGAVQWHQPDAAQQIQFKPGSMAQIDFPAPNNAAAPSNTSCRLLLANGNALEGNLISCDREAVALQTWYAGRLSVPRASLRSLVFTKNWPVVFDGIAGLGGWTQAASAAAAPGESGQWTYRNGAFYAAKTASIARDLKLPDVAEIQFDLAWQGPLNLAIALYTDSLLPVLLSAKNQSPDFGGFYSLRLDNAFYRSIDLWPIKKNELDRRLGQLPFPFLGNKDRMHVDLRVSKPQHKIALSLDDKLVKEWVDPQGFAGEGTGMRFVQNPGGVTKLSRLRVTHWDGIFDEPAADVTHDAFWPEDGAQVAGAIDSISNGKLAFRTTHGPMEIPLVRLKALAFARRQDNSPEIKAGNVRATFAQGGVLTFILESWRPDVMIIRSADFGRARINPAAFTRLRFLFPEKKAGEEPKE